MHSGTAEGLPVGVTGDPARIRETVLVRVNFTPDDVARTRFTVAPAPLVETALALVGLRRAAQARGHVGIGSWVIEARRAFPATARPLLDLLGPRPPWPDFFDSAAPDIEQALEEVRATPWTDLRADLSYAWADRPGRPPTWIRNLGDGDRESVDLVVRALRDLHKAVVAPALGQRPGRRSTPTWPSGYRCSRRAVMRSCSAPCTPGCAGGTTGSTGRAPTWSAICTATAWC